MKGYPFKKYGIQRHILCSICSLPPNQQVYIPITVWAKNNNYTVKQCKTLLRKGLLLGARFKNRYYVMESEELKQ